jgi:hypothetical protein
MPSLLLAGSWWLTALVVAFAMAVLSEGSRKLLKFFTMTPVFAFLIWLDRKYPDLTKPFVGFPRNPKEILAHPELLFALVKRQRGTFRQGILLGDRY